MTAIHIETALASVTAEQLMTVSGVSKSVVGRALKLGRLPSKGPNLAKLQDALASIVATGTGAAAHKKVVDTALQAERLDGLKRENALRAGELRSAMSSMARTARRPRSSAGARRRFAASSRARATRGPWRGSTTGLRPCVSAWPRRLSPPGDCANPHRRRSFAARDPAVQFGALRRDQPAVLGIARVPGRRRHDWP